MVEDVLPYLRCPVCRAELALAGRSLSCPANHTFDLHRHGYVQLSARPLTHTGDRPDMVAARARFLAAGHYAVVARAVTAALGGLPSPLIVDVGAGTGHHLAAVLTGLGGGAIAAPRPVGLALDASRAALRLAARAHPRIGAIWCDGWAMLPVADRVAGAVLDIFAPRNGAEFHRILHPDGRLVVVTPTGDHLRELAEPLGLLSVDPAKPARLVATLGDRFAPLATERYDEALVLTREDVANLVAMGPTAWHRTGPELAAAITALPDPVTVTASINVSTYRPTVHARATSTRLG